MDVCGLSRWILVGLFSGSIGFLSCGYRFGVSGELPGKARTLYVPVFKNQTAEPGIEGYCTSALREELARTGREGGEGSDATVEGTVLQLVSMEGIPKRSYRLQASIKLQIMRGQEKIAETTVDGFEDYPFPDNSSAPGAQAVSVAEAHQKAGVLTAEDRGVLAANAKQKTAILTAETGRRIALRKLAASLMRLALQNLTRS